MKMRSYGLTAIAILFCVSPGAWAHNGGHLVFREGALHIHAEFPSPPVVGSESPLVLEAREGKTHQPVELEDDVSVELRMPSMDHGSAPTQVERALGEDGNILPGVFNVRNVQFFMGGVWEVKVTLTDARGRKETQSFRVMLAGGHHH